MYIEGWKQLQVQWKRYWESTLHFLIVTAGVLCREAYEGLVLGTGYRLNSMHLILALAGSLATFPALQRALRKRQMTNWLEMIVAFQYGFCWRMAMGIEK